MFSDIKILSLPVILALFISCNAQTKMNNKDTNYGPYEAVVKECRQARGPKSKNLTVYTIRFYEQGGVPAAHVNITVLTKTTIEEVKIVVLTINGNKYNQIWRQSLTKPCQHLILGPVIERYVGTDASCVIEKGTYEFDVDFIKDWSQFFGTSFFYGEYLTKINVWSKMGNIYNVNIRSLIKRKE